MIGGSVEPVADPAARAGTGRSLRPGTVLADRYRVDGVLATGAMSVVYTAWDPVLCRPVAVKTLAPRDDDVIPLARHAEARLAASLDHPQVTAVFDAGTHRLHDGTSCEFVVMGLASAGDLRRRLRGGPIAWRDAARIGADVGEALAELHAAGYLHRDVKPANILLADAGDGGRLRGRLADFGICAPREAQPRDALGTAAYVSPEQVHGEPPTERSDVYALGLVLIESLTGAVEFPGSVDETAVARLRHDPVVPATVPTPVARVLAAMTARRPAARPDAAAAARRLRLVLATDAVRAAAGGPDRVADRAADLEAYDVLGWPPLRAFAAATRLACRLLDAPAAFVALATEQGLLVGSPTRGLDLPTHLAGSGWLADDALDRPWAIEDLGRDARTRHDAVLVGAGWRAFAAAPLCTAAGERVATLCVLDTRARPFGRQALDDLAALGGIVLEELELRIAARHAVLQR